MRNVIFSNLKKITALIVAASMILSLDVTAFAMVEQEQSEMTGKNIAEDEISADVAGVEDELSEGAADADDETISDITDPDDKTATDITDADDKITSDIIETIETADETDSISADEEQIYIESVSESDEEARERESMPASPIFCNKLLTYLSIKYPEIGIDLDYGAFGGPNKNNPDDRYDYNYNVNKMADQTEYSEIIIDGYETFDNYPGLTKNMVQFKILGSFGEALASDGSGEIRYSDRVKTLIIRNVDEIRNLYVPASVETLIIENTTLNCYYYQYDSPGFQCGMLPGDLKYCKNLKKLVLKDVKVGDNYKRGAAANLLPEITYDCPYEKNYVLNLQDCHDLEELEIDVSFDGAEEAHLTIDGGTENLFEKLTDDKCNINPAPGTGYEQVSLYANKNSYLSKRYNASETVKFVNGQFRLWLLEAVGIDTNHDGVISQDEMDAVETLTINDQTAHSAPQTSLSAFEELADISMFHKLKNLEIDFYDSTVSSDKGYRHTLKGIDFPDSLENLSMKNIYWEKDTQTKSHADADIRLTNLRTLELYNTDVHVGSGDSYFNHPTQIELEDTEGVLHSVQIERTDVESVILTNNSEGKGIKDQDERQRIRFKAADCQNLKSVEFLGEGYAVEGSLDLANDKELTHIGVPKSADDKTEWTIYGEFDSTYAPVNVVLNSCTKLGSDCKEIIIDYDFINGRSMNVQTMDTNFSDISDGRGDHKLTIYRNPRLPGDMAGKVYISCDTAGWVYKNYKDKDGFVIENRTSFPTIAAFANGQRMRTSGEGQHSSESIYTKDTDCWVERWNLVMSPGGYSNSFGNLEFYVVDTVSDSQNEGTSVDTLRRVFYQGDVYVEWDKQDTADSLITLPTVKDDTNGGYKLKGTKLSSTGIPGEVQLKLYVYNADGSKSYIGFQDIKIFGLPDSVELVNDGTKRGSGTKEDPFIVDKGEELKIKARLLVNNEVDRSGDYALRDVYWRIKGYDEVNSYTSDSDGYSLYTLDSATKAGINVVRGKLNNGETEAQYDKRVDTSGENGQDATYYSHRRFSFDTGGSRFKIVAQSPYKYDDQVKSAEVYVQIAGANGVEVSNNSKLIQGAYGKDSVTVTATGGKNVTVEIKNPDRYNKCFAVEEQPSSTDNMSLWTLMINSDDTAKVKKVIEETRYIDLVIYIDGVKYERRVYLSSVVPDEGTFIIDDIPDQTYTGKAIQPKLNIYDGSRLLVEGKDYTLSYGKYNTNVASKTARVNDISVAPSVTITGKGNYEEKHTVYFSIVPSDFRTATVDDIVLCKTGNDINIKPAVALKGRKITAGTDYVISASETGDIPVTKLKDEGNYKLYAVGIGNYTGSKSFNVTITSDVLISKVSIPKIPKQNYDNGKAIEPTIAISYKGQSVADCFDVEYQNNKDAGTAIAIVTAKDESGFAGTKKLTFDIAGTKISSVKLGMDGKGKIADVFYTGKSHKPELDLYNGDVALVRGKDYSVEYLNNIKAGAATVIVTGKGGYTGSRKLSFKIKPYDVEKDISGLFVANDGQTVAAAYEKGGVMPPMKIVVGDKVLKESKDYTIKYSNNNTVADSSAVKAPTATITFKGNYSGKRVVTFNVTAKDIGKCSMSIADMAVSTKPNGWKQTKFTVTDTNGKKLSAGTDYDKTIKYYSNDECTTEIDTETLGAGAEVFVKIKGINCYAGSTLTGSYRISNLKIASADASVADQAYTGRTICPKADEVIVTMGRGGEPLHAGTDYEIVPGSYKNNINKGTAVLTIRGKGNYYGTKDVKFKIGTRHFLFW